MKQSMLRPAAWVCAGTLSLGMLLAAPGASAQQSDDSQRDQSQQRDRDREQDQERQSRSQESDRERQQSRTLRGRVINAQGSTLTIRTDDGNTQMVTVEDQTDITRSNRSIELDQLEQGDQVTIRLSGSDSTAERIQVSQGQSRSQDRQGPRSQQFSRRDQDRESQFDRQERSQFGQQSSQRFDQPDRAQFDERDQQRFSQRSQDRDQDAQQDGRSPQFDSRSQFEGQDQYAQQFDRGDQQRFGQRQDEYWQWQQDQRYGSAYRQEQDRDFTRRQEDRWQQDQYGPPRDQWSQQDRWQQDRYAQQDRYSQDQGPYAQQDRYAQGQDRYRWEQDQQRQQWSRAGGQASLGVSLRPGREGVLVTDVRQGSPAEEAGIRPGDEIVEIDQRFISEPNQLVQMISQRNEGERVRLTVLRNGQERMLSARLESREMYGDRGEYRQYGQQQYSQQQYGPPQYGGQYSNERAYRGAPQGGYYYEQRSYQVDPRQQTWGGQYYDPYRQQSGYRGWDSGYYNQPYQYQYDSRGPVRQTWGAVRQGTGRVVDEIEDIFD